MKRDLITKTLAVFSPQAAMRRMVGQAKLHNFGRFDSALDSTKRGNSRSISGAEDTAGTAERYKLIRAARDLADNFPPVRSLLLKFATYIAGRLAYQARTGDKDVDEAAERYWKEWCASCDFLRRHDFTAFLQLAVQAILRDGDCGFIIVRENEDLKLQAVEGDRIGSPYSRMIDTNDYIGGIGLDEYGRPKEFEVFVRTINNQYIEPTKIPAAEFIHLFDPTRLDEYRGRSAFASALNAARDLQETIKAEMQAIKYASYQTGVITNENGSADAAEYFAADNGAGGSEKLQNMEAGTINYLANGEKMEMFSSDRPSGAFADFVRLVQSHIAMSVGLPYGFAFDADKSGPMARLEAAMAERTFNRWRGFLESQFLNRIKNIVLLDAASRGLIPDSEYLLDGRWNWPAKVSIDYGREARADIDLWKAGLKTAGQIYADNGEDYEEALRSRAKEAAMIKGLAQEYDLQPVRISDSVPVSAIDITEEGEAPPLISTIGVGGAQSLAFLLSQMATGAISVEQAAVILRAVFGMDQSSIDQLVNANRAEPTAVLPEPTESDFAERDNMPTKSMIVEAEKGLKWRKEYKRGGTAVGVARARDIANGANLSDDTVKRMASYFARHEVDKKGQGFKAGEKGFPSAGRIAWALWGGDAGQKWVARKAKNLSSKTEFVMPSPQANESAEDFISRCMGNDTMVAEYPDQDQRAAVCNAQIDNPTKS